MATQYPVNVMERGQVLARIDKQGGRYVVENFDGRVSSTVDRFKSAEVMRDWLKWAYPGADDLESAEAASMSANCE